MGRVMVAVSILLVTASIAFLAGASWAKGKPSKISRHAEFYVIQNGYLQTGQLTVGVISLDGIPFRKGEGPRLTGTSNSRGRVSGDASAVVNPSVVPLIKAALQ